MLRPFPRRMEVGKLGLPFGLEASELLLRFLHTAGGGVEGFEKGQALVIELASSGLDSSMLYNVSGLVQEGIGATRSYQLDDFVRIEGRAPERIGGSVELLRTRLGVLVRAHLRLVEAEACSRCLRPLEENVAIDFEEEFPMVNDPLGERDEDLDPDAFLIEENQLDLSEAVRQYREVSLEMQPLCRADCRGLCPHCGSDLNTNACDCGREPVDSRWAGLSALANALSEGKD